MRRHAHGTKLPLPHHSMERQVPERNLAHAVIAILAIVALGSDTQQHLRCLAVCLGADDLHEVLKSKHKDDRIVAHGHDTRGVLLLLD